MRCGRERVERGAAHRRRRTAEQAERDDATRPGELREPATAARSGEVGDHRATRTLAISARDLGRARDEVHAAARAPVARRAACRTRAARWSGPWRTPRRETERSGTLSASQAHAAGEQHDLQRRHGDERAIPAEDGARGAQDGDARRPGRDQRGDRCALEVDARSARARRRRRARTRPRRERERAGERRGVRPGRPQHRLVGPQEALDSHHLQPFGGRARELLPGSASERLGYCTNMRSREAIAESAGRLPRQVLDSVDLQEISLPADDIVIHGAREHNLKDVTVRLPRGRLICITGLSGSGKSSLAFDTLYAEGQRRYVESLSAYARQFLGQMDKPDVDSIEGLSPAISIDQKTTSRNPRSTVGTVTEISDYLRLLYARIGHPHCPICGRAIAGQSAEQIVDQVLALPAGTRFTVDAPVVRGRKGEFNATCSTSLRGEGFTRVRVDGETYLIEDVPPLDKKFKHDIAVVVDRLVMKDDLRKRLADSVETAIQLADGLVEISVDRRRAAALLREVRVPRARRVAARDGAARVQLQLAARRVPALHGTRRAARDRSRRRSCPTPTLSIAQGALRAVEPRRLELLRRARRRGRRSATRSTSTSRGASCPSDQRDLFLWGTGDEKVYVTYRPARRGRSRSYMTAFEGIVPGLERRYRETESALQKERIEQYMALRACPACHGARLEARVARGHRRRAQHRPVHAEVGARGARVRRAARARRDRSHDRRAHPARDLRAPDVPRRRRARATSRSSRGAATLSGGEAQRIRLATQIGSSLVGVLYILDEPSIGLHQRDNRRLIATLERLRDLGNTRHRRRARRGDDAGVRLADRHGPGRRRARRPGRRRGHGRAGRAQARVADRRVPLGASADRRPARRTPGRGLAPRARGEPAQPARRRRRDPGRLLRRGDRASPGSGKSTLVNEIVHKALQNRLHRMRVRPGAHRSIEGLEAFDKVIAIDQSPIGRTPRSNPATYTGLFDQIRELYSQTPDARVRGYKPGRFSFNVKGGRCETCKGDGTIKIEMHFLPDVYVPCEVCKGRRYNRETLEVRYQGQVDRRRPRHVRSRRRWRSSRRFRDCTAACRRCTTSGLGYVRLGQPATTLSGGEAQRVKLATRALEGRDGADVLHPRRADDRTARRRCREAARGAAATRRRGQHRARDRAQPRRRSSRPTG